MIMTNKIKEIFKMSVLIFIVLFIVGIGVFFKVSGFVFGLIWQGLSILINIIAGSINFMIAIVVVFFIIGILGILIS